MLRKRGANLRSLCRPLPSSFVPSRHLYPTFRNCSSKLNISQTISRSPPTLLPTVNSSIPRTCIPYRPSSLSQIKSPTTTHSTISSRPTLYLPSRNYNQKSELDDTIRLQALGNRTPHQAYQKITNWRNPQTVKRSNNRLFWVVILLGMGYSAFSVYHFLYIQEHPATEFQMSIIKKLPTRALSTMWGWTNNVELPKWLRVQIFLLWTRVYGCDLDEMRDPLDSYKNLAEFFARRLKPGVRPIQSGMVSPADGKVLIVGEVSGEMVEQVKGIKYELGEFLGMAYQSIMALQPPSKPLKLYHAVIYLAPGDYHGIHAPVDVTFKTRRHFPGYLLPVAPVICKLVPGLFALNERVVLIGEWRHGFFSLTPVGATNVGSIEIALEKHYQTNRRIHEIGRGDSGQKYYEKRYVDRNGVAGISVPKGEELAFFKLGSTVVLIFAAPEFEWEIQPGQKLRMGQRIGRVPGEEPPPNY